MSNDEYVEMIGGIYANMDKRDRVVVDRIAREESKSTLQVCTDLLRRSMLRVLADTRPIPSMDQILGRTPQS